MKRRGIRYLLGLAVIATVAAVSAAVATTASSETNEGPEKTNSAVSGTSDCESVRTDDKNPGGWLEFCGNGDRVTACGIDRDGRWPIVIVYKPSNDPLGEPVYAFKVKGGSGACKDFRASDGKKYDLNYGKKYFFTIQLVNDNSIGYDEFAHRA